MKVYIVSLGCPKNLTDSEVLMGKLAASGCSITNDPSRAEIIIINTCAFLRSARAEALKTIREMTKWKKKGKCQKLYLAGCLPKVRDSIPGVDGIIDSIGLFDYCTPRIKATPPWYAYVKISEGCNNRCSYCLVPAIRGKLRTRKREDVLKEVKMLANRGVKEIIYVAQDTTAYPDFDKLLKETARIPSLRWIRIMYAHPEHLNDKIVKVMASERKIVKYLDLPIQHASDKVLKTMNRRYRKTDLINLIGRLREQVPGIVLRTSIIVGFPGEGGKEFDELLDFVKQVRFEKLGAFIYSREEGTPAGKMKGQVPEKTKKARFGRLMRLQARISKERNRELIGRMMEAVVEGEANNRYFGRTYRDAPEIDGQALIKKARPLRTGEFVKIRITGHKTYDLIGIPA